MKNTTSAFLFTILALTFTACSTQTQEAEQSTQGGPVVISNNSVIARDADGLYSQEAPAIVIGTVGKVDLDSAEPTIEATIAVEEVLKGDQSLKTLTVPMQNPLSSLWIEDSVSLFEGQKVLLFLGTDAENNYVVFAGENGKYVIDENEEVTSVGDFKMPLSEVRAKIEASLNNN